jgi:gliding motility-associated-like protein
MIFLKKYLFQLQFQILICVGILLTKKIEAQCITTFPYTENFEANPAWTSGGTNSDWTWGTPSHPTISGAGEGIRSWCVGDLTGSSYNDLQLSFLESPCFDFTNLDYTWISFKLFWETEFRWDGLTFQYSLDNGSNWDNLGSVNDADDCVTDNWFNHNDITWITSANPKHGWSGRVGNTSDSCTGGNGSGDWVTAKHCMSELAGESSVKFRFLFGSGNSCNNFDGIAIDDILIENTSPYNSNFTYTCLNSSNVSFLNQSVNCSQTFLWEFGDPASGAQNSSSAENPIHNFSGPGTYTVILRTSGPCNEPGFSSKTITILDIESTETDIACFGENTGEISITADQNATFLWSTNPTQTSSSISNLVAGNYSCEISKPNACPSNLSFTITQNPALDIQFAITASCTNFCNGIIQANPIGGEGPYTFSWLHSLLNQNVFTNLCSGNYELTLRDMNGCETTETALVNLLPKPNLICNDLNLCIGSTGFLQASGADSYQWSPSIGLDNPTNSNVLVSLEEAITYELIGTNFNGCKDTIEVDVNVSDVFAPTALFSFSPDKTDVYDTEIHFLNESSGANSYLWTFSDLDSSFETNPIFHFPNNKGGNYLVCLFIENDISCADTFCKLVQIEGKPSVFVPNSFTPNGDKINNTFFPVIRDITNEKYVFSIYNRWGELVFSTTNLDEKWDGTYKGKKAQVGIYSWTIKYIDPIENELKSTQGFVELRE